MLKISKLSLDIGSMVIDEEGYLWAWGRQGSGGLGLGDTTTRYFPVKVGDKTWVQVSRGSAGQTLAIDTEGHLWACGNNEYGQLGLDDTEARNQFEQIGDKTWSQVSCGWNFTLAIDTEGHLWAWGDNRYGQLGTGTTFSKFVPTQIGDKTWTQVSCGSSTHTLAIDTEGHLWACGNNGQGELGLGDETDRLSLTQIGNKTWSQVSCGNDFTLAIDTEGHLWAWGCNDFGQLGLGDRNDRSIPIQVGDKIWTQISCGTQFSMAIDTENQLWVWGTNGAGQLARNSFPLNYSEIPLEITTDNLVDPGFGYVFNGWKAIHASGSSAFAIDTWGYLWVWGYGKGAQLGLGDTNDRFRATFNRIIVSISDRLSFILRQIGTIQTAKSRIQEKFELPDDLDFLSYSEFIKGGGSGEYYLCTYVNRTYETGEFTVSGLPDDIFKDLADWEGNLYPEEYRTKNPNGTYAPYYKSDHLSSWKFKNEHGTVVYYNSEYMAWVFAPFAQGETDYWLNTFPVRATSSWEDPKYPWDSSLEWELNGSAVSFTIEEIIQPPVEQYWNGYKLVMNESGKYDIDYSEEHKLTYADFMPVAGRFYDGDCTVEIQGLNIEELFLSSTPTNMTSNENEEWLITASFEYTETSYPNAGVKHPAYQAFDGTDKDWNNSNDNSSNTFIQWQNKTHKVLLKQLDIYAYDWEEMPKLNESNNNNGGAYLEGSNDGETWKQLTVTLPNGFEYSKGCASFKLTDNYEFFSYHRIRCNNGTNRWVIKEIKGTYLNEREVPK